VGAEVQATDYPELKEKNSRTISGVKLNRWRSRANPVQPLCPAGYCHHPRPAFARSIAWPTRSLARNTTNTMHFLPAWPLDLTGVCKPPGFFRLTGVCRSSLAPTALTRYALPGHPRGLPLASTHHPEAWRTVSSRARKGPPPRPRFTEAMLTNPPYPVCSICGQAPHG